MLALQNMHVPIDSDLQNVHRTPNTTAERYHTPMHGTPTHYLPPQHSSGGGETMETLAAQIRTLTSIATNLQTELTSLSRRSKDNATDLMSLKDATSMRDEDIRRSLKDLSVALNMRMQDLEPLRHHLTEGIKSPSKAPRPFSRSQDRDASPENNMLHGDGTASIALLEKVMREMATKEGMESILRHVEEVKQKDYVGEGDKNVLKMLEEILSVVKEPGVYRALSNASSGAARRSVRGRGDAETDVIEELIKQVHQDVLADGTMTSDVKSLVEETKKELTALGSIIGQKLSQRRRQHSVDDDEEDDEEEDEPASREEIADIVDTGLNALRRHLEEIIDDSHHRSVQSVVLSRDEIFDIVMRALDEHRELTADPMSELERGVVAAAGGAAGMGAGAAGREEVLRAVRDGLETYRPQVEVQTTGLERDEVLECLEEGLRGYRGGSIDYERVRDVISDALADWKGPDFGMRDEGIRIEDVERVVRESLENAKIDSISKTGVSKADVMDAVGDGIDIAKPSVAREVVDGVRKLLEEKMDEKMRIVEREEILATIRDGLATHRRAGGFEQIDPQELSDRIIATIKSTMESLDISSATGPSAKSPAFADISNKDDLIATIKRVFEEANSSPRDIEINSEDISAAVKEGMDLHMTEQLAVLLEEMKTEFAKGLGKDDENTAKVIENVSQGMHKIQSEIEKVGEGFTDIASKEETLGMLRQELGLLHKDLCRVVSESTAAVDPSGETVRLLEALEKEFEHMRASLKEMFSREREGADAKGEIIDAIRDVAECEHLKGPTIKQAIEEIKREVATVQGGGVSKADVAEIVKGVIERITADGTAKDEESKEMEDVLEGLKSELRVIKEKVEQNGRPDQGMVLAGEIGIAKDIETLKAMLNAVHESVRASGERLHEDSVRKSDLSPVLEAIRHVEGSVDGPETIKRAHFDEMMIAVKDVHGAVEKKESVPDNIATREDVDSLETLLHAMKARMDELMAPEGSVHGLTVERFDSLAAMAQETKAILEAMKERDLAQDSERHKNVGDDTIDDAQQIIKDIWVMVEDLKTSADERDATRKDPAQRVLKTDVQALETLTFEIKTLIEELKIPDPSTLPTKVELEALSGLINQFRDKVESDGEMTAQAFEARKIEHGGLAEKIDEAKKFVGDLRAEFKDGISNAGRSVELLRSLIQGLINSSETFATRATINELSDMLNKEFGKVANTQDEARKQTVEQSEMQIKKLDETREKLLGDIIAKFNAKFGELGTRYDEARSFLENKFETARKRDVQHLEALTSAKAVAEDLMGLIREEANSFYGRADRAFSSIGDEMKGHRELVKSEFEKATIAADRLEEQIGQSHPEILGAVREVMDAVSKQFDFSQQAQDAMTKNVEQLPSLVVSAMPKIEMPEPFDDTPVRGKLDTVINQIRQIPPPEKYDDSLVISKLESIISHVKTASSKEEDTMLHEKLNDILESVHMIPEPPKAYDDAPVHGKLDTLLDQATVTGEILLQMDKLDKIQEQVSATQRELEEAMTAQKAWIASEQANKRKELEEAAIILERRKAQKERVEQDILALHDEKDVLLETVRALRNEKDDLTRTTGKLGRELSGLETALRIRREEMRIMEERAEVLEKRVVDGVLDHARSLLVERGSSLDGMNLKRAKRDSGHSSTRSDPITNSVAMALKKRGPPKASFSGAGKRIQSLNNVNINANRPNERSVSIAPSTGGNTSGIPDLKRSQSYKQGLGRQFSLDSRRGEMEHGKGEVGGFSESHPFTSNSHLMVPEEEEEHETPSPNYETPYQTPGRIDTPAANDQHQENDKRAMASSHPHSPSGFESHIPDHDEQQHMITIHGANYHGRRGPDTRSTISSMERGSFGSSTGLTTAASVRGEHEHEHEQDGQRCFSGDTRGDVENGYDRYNGSFVPLHRQDDRRRPMHEGASEYTRDESDSEFDEDEQRRTEVSGSRYEQGSALQDTSQFSSIDDSNVTGDSVAVSAPPTITPQGLKLLSTPRDAFQVLEPVLKELGLHLEYDTNNDRHAMAMHISPVDITHRKERQQLIASLPEHLPFSRYLRAILWYGEIDGARSIVTKCASGFVGSTIWVTSARQVVESWMQRGAPFRSVSRSRSTSPPAAKQLVSYTIAWSDDGTRNLSNELQQAKERDIRCVITKQRRCEAAHIYPHCLTDTQHPAFTTFWTTIDQIFPNHPWSRVVFSRSGYEDSCRNLVCLSADAHVYHSQGSFALRPLTPSDDGTQIQVEFHWLHQDELYAQNTSYSAEPLLYHPDHCRTPYPVGSGTDQLVTSDTHEFVASGRIITITTDDPSWQRGFNSKGGTLWIKGRWVVRGCQQVKGLNYDKTYAAVVNSQKNRPIIAIATALEYGVFMVDFVSALLNGRLTDDLAISVTKDMKFY
ncbi:hypothetical protein KEM56_006396 [Ascosphaera pollenicola]|nr:hypothetical protein KEM56_006396 [Ascosphaera pollenicola]